MNRVLKAIMIALGFAGFPSALRAETIIKEHLGETQRAAPETATCVHVDDNPDDLVRDKEE